MKKTVSMDQHIAQFPKETQQLLELLRMTIHATAPKAEEVISYNMPAFKLNGVLVWFAGYKNHIGFYPSSSPIEIFKKELAKYKTSKGAIQFPLDKPLPLALITKIVKLRIKQDSVKAEAKKKPTKDFLSSFVEPARRALESKEIKTAKQLSKFTQAEIMLLHGIGSGSLPKLQKALKAEGLSFKKS